MKYSMEPARHGKRRLGLCPVRLWAQRKSPQHRASGIVRALDVFAPMKSPVILQLRLKSHRYALVSVPPFPRSRQLAGVFRLIRPPRSLNLLSQSGPIVRGSGQSLPEGPKALEEDWERAGSGAALVLTNQWLL